jgi:hypothetical protein
VLFFNSSTTLAPLSAPRPATNTLAPLVAKTRAVSVPMPVVQILIYEDKKQKKQENININP